MATNLDPPATFDILNLARNKGPGGGWLRRALSQEALCIRSTLAVTLYKGLSPLPVYGTMVCTRGYRQGRHWVVVPNFRAGAIFSVGSSGYRLCAVLL
ncbi:uncharacterized protein N7482_000209 [Penicillium canariense]|uniref:Microbial-type PARG catalytic domain-containing protein n=1 Tax=Penicillium canariense TaxID=189055 RepID=A0A9W9LSX7_9EURO|nr:uncharacterized protein N7482_000209 [Penicillium canariense]KAJ5174332.1 hypothetical protein N7482_000209 [Penicillium canariense]